MLYSHKPRSFVWGVCALTIGVISLSRASADSRCAGVSMPERVQAFGQSLVRNGVGLRRATIFNVHVYVAALYLEQPTHSAAEALKPERSKAMVLHFVRNVSHKELVEALTDGLKKNAGASFDQARAHMESFEKRLPELREGTQLTLAYRKGSGLEVSADGKLRGVESDDAFANLVFLAWLGPRPPDKGLKAGLLGAVCE